MPQASANSSREDYLERIHELIEEKGYARSVDIARALNISQSSVTSMVQRLAKEGLLNYEKYRGLTLTEDGLTVARSIQARHVILKRFLSQIGVPAEIQEQDIEGIEHHLSDETVKALANLSDVLDKQPELLKSITQA